MAQGGSAAVVLLVDDDEDNRNLYAAFLAHRGCKVVAAADGREALKLAAVLRPGVILLDMGLPGFTGWEVAERLKAEPATGACVIVAVSAHAYDHERQAAMDAGVDLYVTKPIAPADLWTRVCAFMEGLGRPLF